MDNELSQLIATLQNDLKKMTEEASVEVLRELEFADIEMQYGTSI